MERQKFGCCGLSCNDCPVFIATENDDDELRQKTARLENAVGRKNITHVQVVMNMKNVKC